MPRPLQGQRSEISKGHAGAALVDSPRRGLTPKDRADLEIDELGRGQTLPPQAGTRTITVRAVVGQCHDQDAGVNDEHGRRAARRLLP